MKPITFKEQTTILTKPKNMTDKECGSLGVYTDNSVCISKWVERNFWKRLKFLFNKTVWITVHSGNTQPPIYLGTESPFKV